MNFQYNLKELNFHFGSWILLFKYKCVLDSKQWAINQKYVLISLLNLRIDMETEEILYGNRSSPSFGSYGQQSKQSAIRTSFFALRNNILEDLQETNSETVI